MSKTDGPDWDLSRVPSKFMPRRSFGYRISPSRVRSSVMEYRIDLM